MTDKEKARKAREERTKKRFKVGEYAAGKYIVLKSTELPGDGDVPPREIQLSPLGNWVHPQFGPFSVTPQVVGKVIANFGRQENDTVIDYEHQTLKDVIAPAAGWIKKLLNRGKDGLWAVVDWTDRATEFIQNKEYRFLSPVILFKARDKYTGEEIGAALHSSGLTNKPFIDGMEPLVNKDQNGEEVKEMIEKLKELLGLEEAATEEDVTNAVQKLLDQIKAAAEAKDNPPVAAKEVLEALELKEGVALKDVTDKISGLKNPSVVAAKEVLDALELKEDATVGDVTGKIIALKNPSNQVSREEFENIKNQLALKDRDGLVAQGIADGKITPANKEWADKYALKDPEGFGVFLAKAPAVVALKDRLPKPPEKNEAELDEAQMVINKQLGIDAVTWKDHGPKTEE